MTEARTVQQIDDNLLQTLCKHDTIKRQDSSGFVDVRTKRGKLIFRFDPVRMLVEWRDSKESELIDLTPHLPR